ncbi:MAG: hypothetical protein A2X25_07055 [Chloroflexi bacterium GWB2_49_20]|nr:MAG: hypothetical protein A2X25_07055 [Chloroflexi bacterium GWB2_49_20]OGN77352.1 MAG: hypothetical protein A2X26_07770 [Chloroflexi bacterium GWC2_49_37]OGN84682.1 MAG: hypothetical protein A2X27_12990 [Chloroflexi bacterium GWD2_49_16]HBG74804.1 hypothetical protein [Anaerolineae bacterium]HCM96360.1 hypothetical protein [Anaerolineae bacterium]
MSLDNYLQETGALATLAGILAGFAISAVIQLLSTDKPGKLSTVTIVVFSGSTVMFVYSLLVFVLLFASAAESNAIPTALENFGNFALLIIFGAINVFLAGIGLVGWTRSKTAGIATTILALITMCLTSFAIISVVTTMSSI